MEILIRSFTSVIRAKHRLKLLKFKNKHFIKKLRHLRCQQPDWWELETYDLLCNLNPIDLVKVRPSPTVSVLHAVQHTQNTLLLPVKEKDNPYEQTVPEAETSKNATCRTQQPRATAEHQPPRHYLFDYPPHQFCIATRSSIFRLHG